MMAIQLYLVVEAFRDRGLPLEPVESVADEDRAKAEERHMDGLVATGALSARLVNWLAPMNLLKLSGAAAAAGLPREAVPLLPAPPAEVPARDAAPAVFEFEAWNAG